MVWDLRQWPWTRRGRPRELMSSEDLARAGDILAHRLRGVYGVLLLFLLIVQLVASNYVMYHYADKRRWDIPPEVMQAWLGATVVELVGLVWVIVSHLFPRPPRRGRG